MADPDVVKERTIEEQRKIDKADEKELTRLQGIYRNYANNKFAIRGSQNTKKILERNIEITKRERREIRTNLSVATCKVHALETEMQMEQLKEHVEKQEAIQKEIDTIKLIISHMNLQLKRLDAKRFEVSKVAITDEQYNNNLQKANRTREILENRLDVSRRQECTQVETNSKLRALLDHMLHDRALFNKLWRRMVVQLSFDKKFLIDMVDRAVLAFNQGAELCNQLDILTEKSERDKKMHITEMMDMIRKLDADEKISTFLSVKGKTRQLNDLEPREYERRRMFREQFNIRTTFYKTVIDEIVKFQGVDNIQAAIDKFNKSDDEYFAHFNYMINLNHQIEFLRACLSRMYKDIDGLREYNRNKEIFQNSTIAALNERLNQKKKDTSEIMTRNDTSIKRLAKFLLTISELFVILKCDSTSLDILLADQTQSTIHNVDHYLSLLETRLNVVLNCVYHSDIKPPPKKIKTVRGAEREKTEPTPMENVVLVQQCAECAEGEVNRYDEEIVYPMEKDEVLAKVRIKTAAPDIQYRLHNLSMCRLPRSRALVNKRYQ